MPETGAVRVGVSVMLVVGLMGAGVAEGGHLPACGDVGLEVASVRKPLPGPLLAAAHWSLLSSVSLWSLPWSECALPAPGRGSARPSVARATDRSEGGPVEVGGDRWSRYEYRDNFGQPIHREDATVDGVSCVRWDREASRLELHGAPSRPSVGLLYHFVAPYTIKDVVAELAGEIEGEGSDRIELALSPDGEDFGHAVGAFGREQANRFHLTTNASTRYHRCDFWVRVRGELSAGSCVRLTCFRLAGRVKPPGRPEVALEPAGQQRLRYRDDFRSRKVIHLAEIQNPKALEWQRGRISVRCSDAGPEQVALRQKFLSPEPLRSVAVRIRHAAGAHSQFGLSLDGRTLLARQAAPGSGGLPDGTAELRLDDERLAQARQFYLHIVLAGTASGPARAASSISCVEVEARTAEPATATAALPVRAVSHD